MKICVITDDNSGFKKSDEKKYGIKILRMPIVINGKVYYQNDTLSEKDFYEYLANDADVTTSQPAPGEVIKLWDETLKTYDQIVHIPMSSGLSESCNTAKMLSEDYKGKVFVVDNHRISVTLRRSVLDALQMIKDGKTGEEIKETLEKEALDSTIYLMVNTLKYLKKGGRITPAAALLGSALHLKPVLTILGAKLDAYTKTIGTKKAKIAMIEAIKNDLATKFKDVPQDELYFDMAYTEDLDELKTFKEEAKKALNIKENKIYVDPLSFSIATHIGPGVIAITCTKSKSKIK